MVQTACFKNAFKLYGAKTLFLIKGARGGKRVNKFHTTLGEISPLPWELNIYPLINVVIWIKKPLTILI